MVINWLCVAVSVLQIGAACWAFWTGDWRLGVINLCVGIANGVLATMAKG